MPERRSHRAAADAHERAARTHAEAAVDFDDGGDPEMADLERRSEEVELEAADIEVAHGQLEDRRAMDARLRALFDGRD